MIGNRTFSDQKREDLQSITANLKVKVEDLTSENNLPDLELLNLVELTIKMGEANTAFNEAFNSRNDEQSNNLKGIL